MTTSAPQTPEPVQRRYPTGRAGRYVFSLAGIFLLLAALSWLFLPGYVQRLATEQVQQQTGRKLEIGAAHFSPFTLALTLEQVRLLEADGKTPALTLNSLKLNLSLSSLLHQALVLDELQLDTPVLHLVRQTAVPHGRYNFSDMLDKVAATPSSGAPLRFSVSNIQIQHGEIVLDDAVQQHQFKIENLDIGVPFISNFPKAVSSFVEPRLSARINGAPFVLKARSKPFTEQLETSLAIDLEQFDITPFLGYIPVALPLQIASTKVSTRLDLSFSRKKQQPEILLSGDLQLKDVVLNDLHSQPLLKMADLQAKIKQFNLLTAAAELQQLSLSAPQVWVSLDPKQGLNWAHLQTPATAPHKTAEKNPAPAAALPLVLVHQIQLKQGQIHFSDAVYAHPAQKLDFTEIALQTQNISTAKEAAPSPFKLSVTGAADEKLQFDGELQAFATSLNGRLELAALLLEHYQAWLNPYLNAKLSAKLDASSQIHLNQGQWQLQDVSLRLRDFLVKGKTEDGSAGFHSLALDKMQLDSASRRIQLDSVALDGMALDIRRNQASVFGVQNWLRSSSSAPSAPAAAGPAGKNNPWKFNIGHAAMKNSDIRFGDQAVSPVVKLNLTGIDMDVAQFSSDLSRQAQFHWQSRLNQKGRLDLKGSISPALRQIGVTLAADNLPVATLYPYFSQFLNVEITQGVASAKGKLTMNNLLDSGRQIAYDGNLNLNDFQIFENGSDDDFLEWKNIGLEGIRARLGTAPPIVSIGKLGLNHFFAKAVLSDQGKLNLQNIIASKKSDAASSAAPASTVVPASAPVATSVTTSAAAGVAAASATAVNAASDKPVIRIAQTVFRDGNVNFTDNFIKPNYHANLTGISGNIGMLASDDPQAATLELNGKIDDDAPVLISGSLNPLSTPVSLDIKGSANGIELTRLTPYATKYAGYPIEKGKLSMQVSYKIDHQQLKAENNIVLDQLTFGEKVDSPTATKLPVMLAVALLRDNDGKININLPISGSLSDPQFSVGGIIFKVFINLITKAITSPFALLGSLFGGGEQLAYLEFPPGIAELAPAGKEKLDTLVKALKNRDSLRLDIIGRVEQVSDTEGLRRQVLENRLREAKVRDLNKKDRHAKTEGVIVTDDERAKYVQTVYDSGSFSKPRNMIGLAKTLPTKEAEALILQNIKISTEDLRLLAQKRADLVRDYLEDVGGINRERLFLIAPRMNADGIKDQGAPNRVDFSLR